MQYPEADFTTFATGLSMQAMLALGEAALPGQEKPSVDLGQAKYLIDTLGVLEEKTKGNLDPAGRFPVLHPHRAFQ